MGRDSTREVIGDIASALGPEPKKITDIAEETGRDRNAVTRYLEALTNHEYIHESSSSDGRSRSFYIESSPVSVDPVKDIPAWSHFERIEQSRIELVKNQARDNARRNDEQ